MRAIHHVSIKHTHNQHITNVTENDTTTITITYEPVLLHMKYHGEGALINECIRQLGHGFPKTTRT